MSQEVERAEVLHALALLDTAAEPEFDTIADGARQMFEAKSAFISFADTHRLFFKARCNLDMSEAPRGVSFCERVIDSGAALVVPDTLEDPRFATNPFVLGPPHIRFYAGVPLHARARPGAETVTIGTLCVMDDVPHCPAASRVEMLANMALVVEALLELRRVGRESLALALERHDTLMSSERLRRQLAQAERMAHVGSWRLDLLTEQVSWSDGTYAIHALPRTEGTDLSSAMTFYPPADRAQIAAAVAQCAEHGRGYDLELDFTDAAGVPRRVRAIGEAEIEGGRVGAIIGVVQDITERHRLEQQLRVLAETDELTGLMSRRAFNDALAKAVAADDTPLAVALLDLDRFKEVNDRLGHAAGDEVLRRTATILRDADFLGDHVAARLGGDEFVMLLHGEVAEAGLNAAMARLLERLRQSVPTAGDTIVVSATIGISQWVPELVDRSALLKAADRALYRAKQARRGSAAISGREALILPAHDEGLASAA